MATTTYVIAGMTGGDCVDSVSTGLRKLPGVSDVRADLVAGTATVTSDRPLEPAAVRTALAAAGYLLGAVKHPRPRPLRHFLRHLAEMVVAMVVGMMVLGPAVNLGLSLLGRPELLQRPDLGALVMATTMTIGMSLWMRYRRHSWTSIAEMGAAMYIPFVVLFVPFWAGLLSGDMLMTGGHILMLPAMVAAMLRRRDEYTRDHRHARSSNTERVAANGVA